MTATMRRVRITIEGDVVSEHGAAIRLRPLAGGLVMVDTSMEGVTLEDVTPPRAWEDGDIVTCLGQVWVREGGNWWMPRHADPKLSCTDLEIDSGIRSGATDVLRYQAGL